MTRKTTCRSTSWILLGMSVLMALSCGLAESTPTATVARDPGLIIQGHVWLGEDEGVGLAGVNIYRSYASYSGELVATTDQDGYYQSDFTSLPGDEMVTVWAELDGYVLLPEQHSWRHYYGYESRTLDFIAAPVQFES